VDSSENLTELDILDHLYRPADSFVLVFGLFYLKESYAPYLLCLRANRLLKETGTANLHTKYTGMLKRFQLSER
jgi:hypothetical protein